MIYLGKEQTLKVAKIADNGVYLYSDIVPQSNQEAKEDTSIIEVERILLPKRQVPEGTALGDAIHVFVYKDSEDRPIATTQIPTLQLGGIATLEVKEITSVGTFLDWGLAKDLLLPYKEQTYRPAVADKVIVALYIDKSQRLCATMKIYNYLQTDSEYKQEDRVKGKVYEILDNFGVYVAVDNKYSALIPNKELYGTVNLGDDIEARVTLVHADGKLNLGIREKAHVQMNTDSELILAALKESSNGFLPYHDKTEPELIKDKFGLSKNAFKRAIGGLLKAGHITITDQGISLK